MGNNISKDLYLDNCLENKDSCVEYITNTIYNSRNLNLNKNNQENHSTNVINNQPKNISSIVNNNYISREIN